jgi:hypothetical protein
MNDESGEEICGACVEKYERKLMYARSRTGTVGKRVSPK